MVVNNVPLSPSPYGYIHSPQCTLTDTTCNVRNQPYCAQNLTSHQHMAMTQHYGLICTIQTINSNGITTTVTPDLKSGGNTSHPYYFIGIGTGTLLITVLLVCTIVTLYLFFCKQRSKQGK